MQYHSVGRFEVHSENNMPTAAASREVRVQTMVECSLKCALRKSYSFALIADAAGVTSYRCLLYDDNLVHNSLQYAAGSVYMVAMMHVTLLDSREVPPS